MHWKYKMKSNLAKLILLSVFCINVSAEVMEFNEPRVEGLRMDRCLTWGETCDLPAANAWCMKHDFVKAIYWEMDNNIAQNEPTKMLLSKQICNKSGCDGFKVIVCYKPT